MTIKLQRPVWQQGYRLQFEPSQKAHVILYPEGMIKLNDTAAAIAQHIDGTKTVNEIIMVLKEQFGDFEQIDGDVIDYMLVAQRENWIKLTDE